MDEATTTEATTQTDAATTDVATQTDAATTDAATQTDAAATTDAATQTDAVANGSLDTSSLDSFSSEIAPDHVNDFFGHAVDLTAAILDLVGKVA